MIASFTHLNANEVNALNPDLTLFLFPVGGIEQHGPHLPLGLKVFEAEEWAKALASKLQERLPSWNFILLPVLPLSIDSITNKMALNVRPHVVRDAIVDQCEELKRMKFLNFAAVSSHLSPKQLVALEDAAKIVSRGSWFAKKRANLISVSSARLDSKQALESPMIALPKEHGGARDTGLMLLWNPSLVSRDFNTLAPVIAPKASVKRFLAYLQNGLDGYWGSPALASKEGAQEAFHSEVNVIAEKLFPWLERGKGRSQFSSGYRFFPMNGSFFKAYLLAVIFFTLMLVWVLWTLRDIFEK